MNPLIANGPRLGLDSRLLESIARLLAAKEEKIYTRDKKGLAYQQAMATLPRVAPSSLDLDHGRIRIGNQSDLKGHKGHQEALYDSLRALMPWRKGPWSLFGIQVDSEWDSSMKWDRLAAKIESLNNRRVLDIGSSCGYYMFRMAAQNPFMVLGIEPYLTFYFQYLALQRYIRASNIYCLPFKLEELPLFSRYFDTVFCMGILYHRKSPLESLAQIAANMKPGGQLVLETLIIPGEKTLALVPEKRYAKMNNVFFLPTLNSLYTWLRRSGFKDICCIDVSPTTPREQRRTDWIQTESLADFLDPSDPTRTVEGYPAPIRAMVLARSNG